MNDNDFITACKRIARAALERSRGEPGAAATRFINDPALLRDVVRPWMTSFAESETVYPVSSDQRVAVSSPRSQAQAIDPVAGPVVLETSVGLPQGRAKDVSSTGGGGPTVLRHSPPPPRRATTPTRAQIEAGRVSRNAAAVVVLRKIDADTIHDPNGELVRTADIMVRDIPMYLSRLAKRGTQSINEYAKLKVIKSLAEGQYQGEVLANPRIKIGDLEIDDATYEVIAREIVGYNAIPVAILPESVKEYVDA